ncbi:MAG: WYL domain-containing protein, partial [Bacteroidales bacterium]|nr:WYL domain-containing protein [Bacteroidales bacterium]
MAKREYILRHQKIIQKLRAGKPVPFEGLQDYLRDQTELHSLDLCISKRTFQRDINEIRSIYGIDIHYDIPGGGYYIDAADTSDIQERILESFDMITSLKMVHDVTRFIQFEKRRPQGTRHFFGLLHAIKNRFVIHLTHQAFYRDEPVVHIIEPWFLKEFRERWYIIGREVKKDAVKTFGLDRIQDFTITKKRFTYPEGYNPDALFKDC